MTTPNQPPSVDPADLGSMTGMFKAVLAKFLQDVDDMLPARVIAFDRATNRATVQPVIAMLTTERKLVTRAQVASIPVFQMGAGGYVLSFPLKPGDLGWIKANDRDISMFLQGLKDSGPNTLRKHTFSDAVFFPDTMMRDVVIEGEDEGNVVLQTVDGSQRVSVWPNQVKITSTTKVVIDAPLTECTGQLVTGTNPSYPQLATFNGNVRATGEVTAKQGTGDVNLSTHTHGGVQPGGGNTGVPN